MEKKKQEALDYHQKEPAGKISVLPTKPCRNSSDLSLAYTPGVAQPCLEIQKSPDDAYKYTSKGNLVGVISNGTAVLGLGNIGPLASKPVMEGKAVLFRRLAGIDAFDIEVEASEPEKFIEIVDSLQDTFGGINLEDIKAPECFMIEEELKKRAKIPIFHDDQHGTAIITAAALLNGLKLVGKKIEEAKIVFWGAGAAALACAEMILNLGAKKENIFMYDSQGLITECRITGMNKYKQRFSQRCLKIPLDLSLKDADVFIGLSKGGKVSLEMIRNMKPKPLIFAMANPDPEIDYKEVHSKFPECIVATGRSDFPNQINNVLGFPFIFRAALDVRAMEINKEMKLAAVRALAELAHQPVPKDITKAYGHTFSFGPDYIIPKPLDPRLLSFVSTAIAKAAIESGAARIKLDLKSYQLKLEQLSKKLAKDFSRK